MADFELRYSPLFYDDLGRITDYILLDLKNEIAAKTFIYDVETAIKKRLKDPLQTAIYPSMHRRQYEYRRILVGNYLIFYVVIERTMIVRRLLYGRRDLDKIL
jgi:plasmid stabilization system protein ParE